MSHQYQQTGDQYGGRTGQYERSSGQYRHPTEQYGQPGGRRPGGRTGRTDGSQRGGQQTGGQRGGTWQFGGQYGGSRAQQPRSFEDHMTDELRIALEDFGELSHVAAWCAKECAVGAPEIGICARICQDVAEIAALNEMLIARDSMFGPEVADAFLRIGTEALAELRRFEHRSHVAETIATIDRTMNACESVLQQVDGRRMGNTTARPADQMSGQPTWQRGRQRTGQVDSQQYGGQSTGRYSGGYGMQGPSEQGQYGQGTSGYPPDERPADEQRY
ncbi:hypothetical protein [Halosolutus gelatinilyticus]|uniref:hypothetical protein n=1 Tax=Halosolutus gelatinilyticus TaxID=2931975 RepID=UPI001FF1CC38|nr:hypothetical protein [Halosolutus gelatinilyticus]